MQLKTLNKSLEDLIIPKVYKNLRNVFSQSNANSLPSYWDEDHTIELDPGKTLFFVSFTIFLRINLSFSMNTLKKTLPMDSFIF